MESETELALYEVAAAVATGQAERDGHSDGVDAAGLTDQREILTRTWIHAVVDSARLCTEAGPIREPTGLVASSPPTSAFAGTSNTEWPPRALEPAPFRAGGRAHRCRSRAVATPRRQC